MVEVGADDMWEGLRLTGSLTTIEGLLTQTGPDHRVGGGGGVGGAGPWELSTPGGRIHCCAHRAAGLWENCDFTGKMFQ